MKRLPGVVVTAILLIIGSLFQLLIALLMAFSAAIERRGLPTTAGSAAPPTWLPWIALGFAAVCIALAAWGIATSIGLFRMRGWARYSALILGGLLVFFGLPGALMMLVMTLIPIPMPTVPDPAQAQTAQLVARMMFFAMALVYAVVSAIGIWWLFYFNRRAVRDAFAGGTGAFTPPRRPILISILAVLNIVGAAMCAIVALLHVPLAIFGLILHGWSSAAVMIAFAPSLCVAGVGLWRLKEWGRRQAIALQCIGLINYACFIFRPSMLLQYMEQVNRSMNIPEQEQFASQSQGMILAGSFSIGILFLIAVLFVLHHYRNAFRPEANGVQASLQPLS